MKTKKKLTKELIVKEASIFSVKQSGLGIKELYGVTDGKAIGTYIEHRFREHIVEKYSCDEGNSARGIDFPDVSVDIKVTHIRQPQSSCPYRSARQKIYGLGYNLLVFVYEKTDNPEDETAVLDFSNTIFIDKEYTADFQTTSGLRKILENDGNEDDLVAFLFERNLPIEEIEAHNIAKELLSNFPNIGYLTISNALQWRLQYSRAIQVAGQVKGVLDL